MTSTASDTPKVSAGFDINAEFRSVMHELGLSPEDTGGKITFVGEDPIFPSVHRLGACIGIPLMAGAAGIADIWRQRTGRGQDLTLDLRKAIHGINPGYKFMPTVNGYPLSAAVLVRWPPNGVRPVPDQGRSVVPADGGLPAHAGEHVHVPGVLAGQGQHRQGRVPVGQRGTRQGGRRSGRRLRHRPHARRVGSPPSGQVSGRQAVGGNRQDRRQ